MPWFYRPMTVAWDHPTEARRSFRSAAAAGLGAAGSAACVGAWSATAEQRFHLFETIWVAWGSKSGGLEQLIP